jgi:probable HAF family extracellular repeat protein
LWSWADAINDKGQIVGDCQTDTSHAVLWEKGPITDLGNLLSKADEDRGREVDSSAAAINDRGQIVRWSTTRAGKQHAVLWTLRPAR